MVVTIKNYEGFNLKELELLGKGTQGKVYRIDSTRCIKIFKSKSVCKDEYKTLMIAQGNAHFPKLYSAGKNYIIRECINGIELNKYLLNHPPTSYVFFTIIEIYETMKMIGYSRLDSAIFHIFVTPDGSLKLIDTSKALKKKAEYPELILSGLNEIGCKEEFLSYVKHTRPDLYMKWAKYPRK